MSPITSFLIGLAIFLVGIYLVARYIGKIIGPDLKKYLQSLGSRTWLSVMTGIASTAIVQSSSVISSLAVALAGAGVISVVTGIAIFMGADIGTTITAQLIAFPILHYGPWVASMGMVIWLLGESGEGNRYLKIFGASFFSIGLIFTGLYLMSGAFSNLSESNIAVDYLVKATQYPWLIFLLGIALTSIMQSSSAAIGIILSLVISGVLEPLSVVPFVLGTNVGTTVTENIASLVTPYKGKVVARASFLFDAISAVVVMLLLPYFLELVDLITPASASAARFVANAHTIFNVIAVLVFFPLIRWLAKAGRYLVIG